MNAELPSGTVTFLFTDIEGSTRLLEELGAERYADVLAEHHRACREAWSAHRGVEVDTAGDAFFVVFECAGDAAAAATAAQAGLAGVGMHVRMGLHTGEVLLAETGYVGMEVHRAARITAAAHGGQVVVSSTTAAHLDAALKDLGEHRFKDLAAPERVFQLGDSEFAPLKSLYRVTLPVPATPFLGRESELAAVAGLVVREDMRVLTLTGPGGTGKSRLALQAAAEASDDFPDGVSWAGLAPLRDPALVLSALAEATGSLEDSGRSLVEVLADRLGGKRTLLVVDNAEHLLPAVAADLAALRDAVPTLTLMVTSRERLQLAGEHVYAVPSMQERDSIELFLARARALEPGLLETPELAELCRRLDHLPLAIELAAARTVLFTPEQLLGRLGERLDLLKGGRDADPRQRTLRATIEWSYDLLDEDEQAQFARLAVFVGGCSTDAAEEVCVAAPDTLQSLLDKSLVRRRDAVLGPRLWMLETIREFAAQKLEESGAERDIRARHAAWIRRHVSDGTPPFVTMPAPEWSALLRAEEGNLRGALDWLETEDPAAFEQTCGEVWPFWYFSSRILEARARLEGARATAVAHGREPIVPVLNGLANILWKLGDYAGSLQVSRDEVDLCRRLGDVVLLAEALRNHGIALFFSGESDAAAAAYEESAALSRGAGHSFGVVGATINLGMIALEKGEWDRARELSAEAEIAARGLADDYTVAITIFNQGLALLGLRRPDAARPLLAEALEIGLRHGWPEGLVYPIEALAIVLIADGQHVRGARAAGAAAAAREEFGLAQEEPQASFLREALDVAQEALGDHRFAGATRAGQEDLLEQVAKELLQAPA